MSLNLNSIAQSSASLRIHHAAMRIFAELGGTTLSISDVAKEAGLSRGTVYNNLPQPEHLFASVCEMIGKELDTSFEAVTAEMRDPAESTVRGMHQKVTDMSRGPLGSGWTSEG